MPTLKKRVDFKLTEEGAEAENALREIDTNNAFNTSSSYSANTSNYPDNLIPFVDKHMKYLTEHPAINIQEYLSNLRLMTRIRR